MKLTTALTAVILKTFAFTYETSSAEKITTKVLRGSPSTVSSSAAADKNVSRHLEPALPHNGFITIMNSGFCLTTSLTSKAVKLQPCTDPHDVTQSFFVDEFDRFHLKSDFEKCLVRWNQSMWTGTCNSIIEGIDNAQFTISDLNHVFMSAPSGQTYTATIAQDIAKKGANVLMVPREYGLYSTQTAWSYEKLLPTWVQIGNDLNGVSGTNTRFGESVSISSDGNRVAVGAPFYSEFTGYAQVYEWIHGRWEQIGNDIDGLAKYDKFGSSVALSSDGERLAIGAPLGSNNAIKAGYVCVYQLKNNKWMKMGEVINGAQADEYAGSSVSLSSNGKRLAVGAPHNFQRGSTRIYEWTSGTWTKIGDIPGGVFNNIYGDGSGKSVSLSSNGMRVAIGAFKSDGSNGSKSGQTRVYEFVSSNQDWAQVGDDMNGDAVDDRFGYSVSISADGNRVVAGAYRSDNSRGYTRVFELSSGGTTWEQLGNDIDGEEEGDQSSYSVCLSPGGNRVAIGANFNNSKKGHTRVYELNDATKNGDWELIGDDIDSENSLGQSGSSVSLSSDGKRVAISARIANLVRVHELF